jgi:hypothetical protein
MNVLCKNVVCSCYYVLFRICTLSFREELKSIASVHPLRVTGLALQKLPYKWREEVVFVIICKQSGTRPGVSTETRLSLL